SQNGRCRKRPWEPLGCGSPAPKVGPAPRGWAPASMVVMPAEIPRGEARKAAVELGDETGVGPPQLPEKANGHEPRTAAFCTSRRCSGRGCSPKNCTWSVPASSGEADGRCCTDSLLGLVVVLGLARRRRTAPCGADVGPVSAAFAGFGIVVGVASLPATWASVAGHGSFHELSGQFLGAAVGRGPRGLFGSCVVSTGGDRTDPGH